MEHTAWRPWINTPASLFRHCLALEGFLPLASFDSAAILVLNYPYPIYRLESMIHNGYDFIIVEYDGLSD